MITYLLDVSNKIISVAVSVTAAVALVLATPMSAAADQYDERIKALTSEAQTYQVEAGRLGAQADTLANKIETLDLQKHTLQTQVALNEAKHDKLAEDIADNEARLERQKNMLGKTLASMYIESDVSALEMVASSRSIGDFLSQYEYRNAIRSQIQSSIGQVKDLKGELEEQQVEVTGIIADQQSRKATLASQEVEQQRLLNETRGQEVVYQELTASRSSEAADLRQQQIEANDRALAAARAAAEESAGAARSNTDEAADIAASAAIPSSAPIASGAHNGGYPAVWANAPKDSLVDSWGMYNRECVSYTAFKVSQSGKRMPYWGGRGNANEWPSSARTDGIQTGSAPRAGAVAILMAGPYGHAMFVERVNGDGTILISQYNADWQGNYSESTISSSGLTYIYF